MQPRITPIGTKNIFLFVVQSLNMRRKFMKSLTKFIGIQNFHNLEDTLPLCQSCIPRLNDDFNACG